MAENVSDKFSLALKLVNNTHCNVFLTGKAGSGKTTFLKEIVKKSHKNTIVTATTGVAAINAGGVTLHSFFSLPFLPYIPHKKYYGETAPDFANKNQLTKNARFTKDRIDTIKALELLIIDEVSMLRADLLDALNDILQYVRKSNMPFGGVQLLLIGDLMQLPPVLVQHEAEIFNQHYNSPFFFDAFCFNGAHFVTIELDKIYRQKDSVFINLLNNIRNNELSDADIKLLNSRYTSWGSKHLHDAVILTTHNYQANQINQNRLHELSGQLFTFKAHITGDFPEKYYPADEELSFKTGAQVMFIKNDTDKHYYNGKIGIITEISEDSIRVKCSEDTEALWVEPIIWENKSFKVSDDGSHIEEEITGTFKQYPLKLAWAVTIHKSQGLTFDKVIIDAAKAFAAGQVYVALSRCTSLNGIFLLSYVSKNQIFSNQVITDFLIENSLDDEELKQIIQLEKPAFIQSFYHKIFDINPIISKTEDFKYSIVNKNKSIKAELTEMCLNIIKNSESLQLVQQKLIETINHITNQPQPDYVLLQERVNAAKKYFTEKINQDVILQINTAIDKLNSLKRTKQLISSTIKFKKFVLKKIEMIENATLDIS